MDIAIKDKIYYLEVLVTNVSGTGEEDLDVYYEIFRSDDDVVTISGYLGEVGGGVYKKDVFFPDLGQHRVLYTLSPDALPGSYPDTVQGVMVIEEAIDVTVQAIKNDVDFIKNIEGGKWKIINDQMIFYASDNETEVARFNLFDEAGNPSMINVFSRERV